jgi:hypothetical protein
MIGYPSGPLLEEVAGIAADLHWSYAEIMGMDHRERRRWVTEVRRIRARQRNAGDTPEG